jgi:hemerythrin-like domain-containing protein
MTDMYKPKVEKSAGNSSPLEQMEALLSMIEPHSSYKGGMVSYQAAKDFFDFVNEYVDTMRGALDSAVHYMNRDVRHVYSENSEEYKRLDSFVKRHKL